MNPMCRGRGCARVGLILLWGSTFWMVLLIRDSLLPPDMREWLDPGHLAFFIVDAVDQFDLSGFGTKYRPDGRRRRCLRAEGTMVRLLLFAYCEGVRSSRQIERRCVRDVAYRVWRAIGVPTTATIARFRDQHRQGLRGLFVQVLRLCAEAGLVRVGLLALDGTKLVADASSFQNYDAARLQKVIGELDAQVQQMLVEAARQDAAEDAAEQDRSDAGGPPELRNPTQRLAKLKAAKQRLDAEAAEAQRIQDQRRADWETAPGRKGGPPARPPQRGARNGKINLTDPDSRIMHTRDGFRQAFNGQAVVTSDRLIVAAEVAPENTDFDAFHPMLDAARANLDAAGVTDPMRAVVADAGYSNKQNRTQDRPAGGNPILLMAVPRLGGKKPSRGAGEENLAGTRQRPVTSRHDETARHPGREPALRAPQIMVEPVFGQIKQLGGPRMRHRGRDKVNTEWIMMAAAHNLLKCWRHSSWQPAY